MRIARACAGIEADELQGSSALRFRRLVSCFIWAEMSMEGVKRGQGVLIDHSDIGTAQAEPLLAHLEWSRPSQRTSPRKD